MSEVASPIGAEDRTEPETERSLVAANDVASYGPGGAKTSILSGVTPDSVKCALQSAGYRVEVLAANGITVLRSATSGLPFETRFFNRRAGSEDQHLDMTFVALFAVRGTFPEKLLNEWNRTRRFGRLFLDQPIDGQDFLVLGMDVAVAGGVSESYLRTRIEIWDALLHQLVAWLRHALPTAVEPGAKENVSAVRRTDENPAASH